ncbi:thioredoxin family protein [Paucibacter sp. PLA-PC-4]|uniref:thioredoxin family protein n=1 Tax=Paucibacter sp. PLA-PC-4 TaxID=2993655 RepID=UPI00224ACCCA|nr:thioredoxin family protein [Paucibacter sp. PLA-PC-4]MCX2864127.1 thioredoxin family protein [Paucibacter sp. PLA-PC-4]
MTDLSLSNPARRCFLAALASLAANAPLTAGASPDGLHDWGDAPDFQGITQWMNTPALSLTQLRGQVVLVDFWTFACINCLRTLPQVNRWAETYRAQGLVVVGVHTPEFAFERSASAVQAAMKRHSVRHPVAMDNNYATWKAYENTYWPAHYLVDGRGRIRYRHFGEGEYARTEAAIQALLARPGRV